MQVQTAAPTVAESGPLSMIKAMKILESLKIRKTRMRGVWMWSLPGEGLSMHACSVFVFVYVCVNLG
jgi:hypothetical protein